MVLLHSLHIGSGCVYWIATCIMEDVRETAFLQGPCNYQKQSGCRAIPDTQPPHVLIRSQYLMCTKGNLYLTRPTRHAARHIVMCVQCTTTSWCQKIRVCRCKKHPEHVQEMLAESTVSSDNQQY